MCKQKLTDVVLKTISNINKYYDILARMSIIIMHKKTGIKCRFIDRSSRLVYYIVSLD